MSNDAARETERERERERREGGETAVSVVISARSLY